MLTLKSQAIQTALVGDWPTAINLNQLLLEENPDDIDTLNRLAFALMSAGKSKDAKHLYEKVLMLDMQNPIAIRNIKRLNGGIDTKAASVINNLFIEEPGKTKVMNLINIAEKNIISYLRSGERVEVKIKRSKLFAYNLESQFIGMLPDDICQRLIKFMEAGNEYEAYIRTVVVESNKVSIFIRETKRAKKFKNQPSFISNTEKPKFSLSASAKKRAAKAS